MLPKLRPVSLLCSLMLLSACSTLSKDECLNADWYLIGLEDGSHGYDISRIGSHRQACARVNITPDLKQYRAGLNDGYKTYCTAGNGYSAGLSGATYHHVCQGKRGEAFLTAYQHGQDLYRLRQAKLSLDQLISDNNSAIDQLQQDNESLEEQLVHRARSPGERQELLNAIKENERNAAELSQSIVYSERERAVLTQDIKDLEAYHRQLGYL